MIRGGSKEAEKCGSPIYPQFLGAILGINRQSY
jgi:hypothetical protein